VSINELVYPKCPKCEKVLKPSVEFDTSQKLIKFDDQTVIKTGKITRKDLLVCRYCKISVKPSVLRKQKDPIKFLEDFKKIPIGYKISEETKEKIRLKEDHKENLKKYKHYPVPNKCPYCKSEDIVADCSDHGWICISCDEYFEWYNFRIIFHGDVELAAESETYASEKGYYLLKKGYVDIETDVDWM